jgi:NTE family protein
MPYHKAQKLFKINLALQGGGAYGAFSWGVLDRLLEESKLEIEGISACSAGAINACLLVSGYQENGRKGAVETLKSFWDKISSLSLFGPFQKSILDKWLDSWSLDLSPFFFPFDIMTRLLTPYINLLLYKELEDLLENCIHYKNIENSSIKLFITSTNVHTGLGKLFSNKDISSKVLLSSISIPTFFPATFIGNESYWDGSYSGNPPFRPLVNECTSKEIILIKTTPGYRKNVPIKTADIIYRINEIAFNMALTKEYELIKLLKNTSNINGEGARWAKIKINTIESNVLSELPYSSKLNLESSFINKLFNEGRKQASSFLQI